MKLSQLLEDEDELTKVLEWLHSRSNIKVSSSGIFRKNTSAFTPETVTLGFGKVNIDLSGLPGSAVNIAIANTIPFKFGKVSGLGVGEFRCVSKDQSWENIPEEIDGTFCSNCPLEFVPKVITQNYQPVGITSLKDIGKHNLSIGWKVLLDLDVKSNILGLLKIRNICSIKSNGSDKSSLGKAVKILNKYIGKGQSGVLKAQRELLDNDLDDFAEL